MDVLKLLRDFFAPIPDYSKRPTKKDTRTDEEIYIAYQKERGTYLPPDNIYEKFCSAEPHTRQEISNIVNRLRSEYQVTPEKTVFFQKNRDFFNCYAYASGGVGNPFVMDGYDKPDLTTAVPGSLGGKPMRFVSEQEIHRGMVADGYTPVISDSQKATLSSQQIDLLNEAAANAIIKDKVLVAAFIDDRGDKQEMHFAVRSQKGVWSQKFGQGKIENKDFNGSDIKPPHLGTNAFQRRPEDTEHGYRFIGYYWRPEKGIDVTAAIIPVIGIPKDKSGEYRKDVWLSANESDLHVAKEVRGWSAKKNADGSITVGLEHDNKQRTFVTLPKESIITLNEPENGGKVDYISIIDPSGPATQIRLLPNGKQKQESIPYPAIKRTSPFRD